MNLKNVQMQMIIRQLKCDEWLNKHEGIKIESVAALYWSQMKET